MSSAKVGHRALAVSCRSFLYNIYTHVQSWLPLCITSYSYYPSSWCLPWASTSVTILSVFRTRSIQFLATIVINACRCEKASAQYVLPLLSQCIQVILGVQSISYLCCYAVYVQTGVHFFKWQCYLVFIYIIYTIR